jgi:hypothetical protein
MPVSTDTLKLEWEPLRGQLIAFAFAGRKQDPDNLPAGL